VRLTSKAAQNKTPHCCIINTKSLMLAWLDRIIELRQPSPAKPLRRVDDNRGWAGFIRTCPSDVHDGWGAPTWDVCDASIQLVGQAIPTGRIPAGWFPSRHVATEWLEFIKTTGTLDGLGTLRLPYCVFFRFRPLRSCIYKKYDFCQEAPAPWGVSFLST
jgi:hypothetical protein